MLLVSNSTTRVQCKAAALSKRPRMNPMMMRALIMKRNKLHGRFTIRFKLQLGYISINTQIQEIDRTGRPLVKRQFPNTFGLGFNPLEKTLEQFSILGYYKDVIPVPAPNLDTTRLKYVWLDNVSHNHLILT